MLPASLPRQQLAMAENKNISSSIFAGKWIDLM